MLKLGAGAEVTEEIKRGSQLTASKSSLLKCTWNPVAAQEPASKARAGVGASRYISDKSLRSNWWLH